MKKNYKNFEFENYGEKVTAHLEKGRYVNNNNIALIIVADEGEWGYLTVNLVDLNDDSIVVDNNNLKGCDVIEVLEGLGVLEPTEIVIPCGFCTYKVYKLTEKLNEYCVERG